MSAPMTPAAIAGTPGRERGPAAGLGLDGKRPGHAGDPLSHAAQAEAGPVLDASALRDGEPDAVVPDVERDDVANEGQRQAGTRGAGMPGNVGERLLGDAQQRHLDLGMKGDHVAGHGDIGRDAVAASTSRW